MQRNITSIEFEDKQEIAVIMDSLDTFLEEHPRIGNNEKKTVERLITLLDYMQMEW